MLYNFESEQDFKEGFIEDIQTYHWETETEVWSDCGSARVDVIAEHPSVGRLGFELKFMDGKTGILAAEALKQLVKYRNCEFGGEQIKLWALAVCTSDTVTKREKNLIRSMFNDFGFGFVHYSGFRLTIYFGMLNAKIPLKQPHRVEDMGWIEKRVEEQDPDW